MCNKISKSEIIILFTNMDMHISWHHFQTKGWFLMGDASWNGSLSSLDTQFMRVILFTFWFGVLLLPGQNMGLSLNTNWRLTLTFCRFCNPYGAVPYVLYGYLIVFLYLFTVVILNISFFFGLKLNSLLKSKHQNKVSYNQCIIIIFSF